MERQASAKIYRVNLNAGEKVPEGAEYVTAVGRIQRDYLYVIDEEKRAGRVQSARVYSPFTAAQWTAERPASYIVALHYGYYTRPSRDGTELEYSLDDNNAERTAARPSEADVSTRGTCRRCPRLRAETPSEACRQPLLLDQTGFPDGKPQDKYGDIRPVLPWLLPAGRPLGAALVLVGAVGLLRQQSPA